MSDIIYFLKQINTYSGKILYINLIAMIFIGLLDGVGVLLLIPMISMSGIVSIDTSGTRISGFFELFQGIHSMFGLPIVLGIFVLIVIGQNLLQRYISIQNAVIQHSFFRHMRVETYGALLHANWGFFIKKRKSDLVNIMTGEIARAGSGTYSFLEFMSAFIFTLIQISLAFWLSPSITTFVILFGVVLIYINRKFLKRSLELGKRNYELGKSYLAGITDQLNGIK